MGHDTWSLNCDIPRTVSRTGEPGKRPELDLGELGHTVVGITRENNNLGTGT